jgi:hypothetical protein
VDCDEFESDDEYNTEYGLLLGEDVFIQVCGCLLLWSLCRFRRGDQKSSRAVSVEVVVFATMSYRVVLALKVDDPDEIENFTMVVRDDLMSLRCDDGKWFARWRCADSKCLSIHQRLQRAEVTINRRSKPVTLRHD